MTRNGTWNFCDVSNLKNAFFSSFSSLLENSVTKPTVWVKRHAIESLVLVLNVLHVARIKLYFSFRVTSIDREQATEHEEYFRARYEVLRTGY